MALLQDFFAVIHINILFPFHIKFCLKDNIHIAREIVGVVRIVRFVVCYIYTNLYWIVQLYITIMRKESVEGNRKGLNNLYFVIKFLSLDYLCN